MFDLIQNLVIVFVNLGKRDFLWAMRLCGGKLSWSREGHKESQVPRASLCGVCMFSLHLYWFFLGSPPTDILYIPLVQIGHNQSEATAVSVGAYIRSCPWCEVGRWC